MSELLKRLEREITGGVEATAEREAGSRAAVRKTGIDLEPSGWPIGGGMPSTTKGSSRLFSWRSDPEVQDAIAKVALYLNVQRDQYFRQAEPLSEEWKQAFSGFYSSALLERVRIKQLQETRVENPWFYESAKSKGIVNLPNMAHRAVVTFLDVIVFNERITARHLFHGLVHTAQVKVLGAERYAELFVAGFLQARSYFLVPLKAHAFALDTRYAEDPAAQFSVEEEVKRWATQGRY